MKKLEKGIDDLIKQALEESKLYLDMYNERLKKYQDDFRDFELNKDKYLNKNSLMAYELEKNKYLKEIEKYKSEIKIEENSIKRLLDNNKM